MRSKPAWVILASFLIFLICLGTLAAFIVPMLERDSCVNWVNERSGKPLMLNGETVSNANIISPDGTYVAANRRAGNHCRFLEIYDCQARTSTGIIGCEGIFPAASTFSVWATDWVGMTELRIGRWLEGEAVYEVMDMTQTEFVSR